ncbi:uncharacterized protein LOC124195924 isoform X2 [Daphnia pulex]|uniref:uncharacterized protein LOC124195924 isoform X2 n=1 Tax=Daphnia pulex TaxID=6669 RepID=UPI001EE049D3|nr:uncharacterized protein LOC124195924 isoform X2 [Daphnia pulex]
MTNVCRVHGSTSECVSSQFAKLKIAVALVVIRDKPAGQNVKDFVNNLISFHQDKDQRWKAEYHRLKQEVLQLRQQQLLFAINSRLNSQSSDDVSRRDNRHSRSLLTPPDSQSDSQPETTVALLPATLETSSSSSSSPGDVEDVDRMEFLRAYFYLEHQLRSSRPTPAAISSSSNINGNEILEKDVIRQSVLSVLQHVELCAPKEQCDFSKCLDSLRVCVRLLDAHDKWSQPVRAKFIELSSSWLQRVNHGDSVLRHYALLEILADSDGMAVQLAGSLVKSIAESQQRMNEWEWDGTELIPRPVLAHFSSASYYFLLLEKTIPRMAPSDKSRFVTSLSHVEQRVHLNFPLFAASMMRLAHQLATS